MLFLDLLKRNLKSYCQKKINLKKCNVTFTYIIKKMLLNVVIVLGISCTTLQFVNTIVYQIYKSRIWLGKYNRFCL